MIRFIDLKNQITFGYLDVCFAFYDTVREKFVEFSDSQTWDCIDDFVTDFENSGMDYKIERFLDLIPNQFFK